LKPTFARQAWVFDFRRHENFEREMKNRTRNKLFKNRFKPQTRFELGSPAPVPLRGQAEDELEQLKARLLQPLLAPAEDSELHTALRRAASEAASVAWFTPFPLLFFPTLLEEKAAAARRQLKRQRQIRERSQGLIEDALSE
jgi:hypothetical protein